MIEVHAKGSHACGIRKQQWYPSRHQAVICWGLNNYGQSDVPEELKTQTVFDVSAGVFHNCVITAETLVCFGLNSHGQTLMPPILADQLGIYRIYTGYLISCLKIGESSLCWGDTFLGKGAKKVKRIPQTKDREMSVDGMDIGFNHAIVIDTAGALVGWGANDDGECDIPKK